jgi:hypothetical protein
MSDTAPSLSDTARPDLDALLRAVLPHAQALVRKYGKFFPFGATMRTSGEVVLVAASDGREQPPAQDLIDQLLQGFRSEAGDQAIRATALCFDARAVPPGQADTVDAIAVRLEHRSGEAVDVCLPYRKSWLRRVQFGNLFAARGTAQVFV